MSPRIRAVLFDVDGTLYAQPPLRLVMACEMALAGALAFLRGQRSPIRVIREFRRIREAQRWDGSGRAAADPCGEVAKSIGCSVGDVQAAVSEWMYRRPLKWLRPARRRGLEAVLDELHARRMACGVFSDYPAAEKILALGLKDRFGLTLSATDAEVGAFKPAPQGFLVACARWGLSPDQVLYVGDRVDVDARGAAAAGLRYAVLGRRSRAEPGGWVVRNFKELRSVIRANS